MYDVISSMRFEHGNGYDHVHVFGLDRIDLRCSCCYCCVVVDYCCTVSTGTSFNEATRIPFLCKENKHSFIKFRLNH